MIKSKLILNFHLMFELIFNYKSFQQINRVYKYIKNNLQNIRRILINN
jgi:hypothetical protein